MPAKAWTTPRCTTTAGDDVFYSTPAYSDITGPNGFYDYAAGIDSVTGIASTGADLAYLFDSRLDDTFTASPTSSSMTNASGMANRCSDSIEAMVMPVSETTAHTFTTRPATIHLSPQRPTHTWPTPMACTATLPISNASMVLPAPEMTTRRSTTARRRRLRGNDDLLRSNDLDRCLSICQRVRSQYRIRQRGYRFSIHVRLGGRRLFCRDTHLWLHVQRNWQDHLCIRVRKALWLFDWWERRRLPIRHGR